MYLMVTNLSDTGFIFNLVILRTICQDLDVVLFETGPKPTVLPQTQQRYQSKLQTADSLIAHGFRNVLKNWL